MKTYKRHEIWEVSYGLLTVLALLSLLAYRYLPFHRERGDAYDSALSSGRPQIVQLGLGGDGEKPPPPTLPQFYSSTLSGYGSDRLDDYGTYAGGDSRPGSSWGNPRHQVITQDMGGYR
jgi:hypothetical protein